MKVVGICGSSGSGKSTVCDFFRKRGVPVLDCDEIYHELVSHPTKCLLELADVFGENIISDGALDRKALGKIVFSDKAKLLKLNEISHRHVKNELDERINSLSEEEYEFCLIDAPMLFEAGLEKKCDLVCSVISSEDIQIRRICERDNIKPEEAKSRLKNQISPNELRNRSDLVIENLGNITDLERYCYILLEKIYELKG